MQTKHLKTYMWKGIDENGNYVEGIVEAINFNIIIGELKRKNITPIKIKTRIDLKNLLFTKTKIKSKHITDFSKQLAALMNANLPLVTALETIGKDYPNQTLGEIIIKIKNDISKGTSLSKAFIAYPTIFNELFCNLINAGEESGTLDKMLNHLALYMERIESQKHKIIKAMIYPLAVIVVAFVVTIILMVFVIPQFKEMFTSFGATLPAYTRFIIKLAEFLQAKIWLLLAGITIAGIIFKWKKKYSPTFNHKLDFIKLKIPIIGTILKFDCIARLTRTLAITFKAGISLLDALKIAASVTNNHTYQQAVLKIQAKIANGNTLHATMNEDPNRLFPARIIQLIKIGEESGTLDDMLFEITRYYETEINYFTDNLNNLLEPMIMVILGIIVGGLIIAMYLPIFRLGKII